MEKLMPRSIDTHKPECACPACAFRRRKEGTKPFLLRLPEHLRARLEEEALITGRTRTQIVVEALERMLGD